MIPIDSTYIILSVGVGSATCGIIVVLIWCLNAYLKKRILSDQGAHTPVKSHEAVQEERRQHPGVDFTLPVRVETPNGTIEAEMKNIGLGGAFVCCQKVLPLGETFVLTIEPPDHKRLTLNAEVVWSNINVPDEKIVNRGMGIRFIQIRKDDRESLNQLVSAHLEKERV
ncbi:MAG: PilZ domain-containing protein [Desulfobacterales bacterium]|nr:PilZ domain-containing protein [Desulfobacterales bacterium]